jgi:uncharacterized protein
MSKLFKNNLFVVIVFVNSILFAVSLKAQSSADEMSQVLGAEFRNARYEPYKPEFLLPDSRSSIIKYNPVSLVFGSFMYAYQSYFSLQFSSVCLYEPTCSHMSKEYIREFGIIKGVIVSADRLTRCNRLSFAQIHPLRINPQTGKVNETICVYRFRSSNRCRHVH